MDIDLTQRTATEMVTLLRAGDLTPHDALDAVEARIDLVEGTVNALPIQFLDAARAAADGWRRPADGDPTALLAGLPVAVKDYNDVGGQITSHGSPVFATNRPARDDATVRRLRAAGGIPYAKSNVPEIAGGHTYNPVWGATRNPWNPGRTAGGSSGGAAAALASGTAWLATGSDLGGSLRTPSGYNGTVAVRPTPGLVPRSRPGAPFDPLLVDGPMARNVRDTALFLDAMCGGDRHDPLSRPGLMSYLPWVDRDPDTFRVGYSADLGEVAVDAEVRRVVGDGLKHVEAVGGDITSDCPDFSGAYEAFQALRAHLLASLHGHLLDDHRDQLKDDIAWNIQFGRNLTSEQLRVAEQTRSALVHRVIDFFDAHDVLICPTAPMPAFPVDLAWPTEIDGTELRTYIDWISITFFVSLTGCPVLAMPCGRTASGTPIGFQIVGPPHSEGELLSIGAQIETSVGLANLLPITPKSKG